MNQRKIMNSYFKEFSISMTSYIVLLFASQSILDRTDLTQFWRVIISISPAVPVFFVILSIMRLLISSDELQQRIQLSATAFSAAVTGFVTFSYGFLELVGFPKFPTFLILPMLIALWGISLGYFTRKYQ